MRMAGLAMLMALVAGTATAQTVSKPSNTGQAASKAGSAPVVQGVKPEGKQPELALSEKMQKEAAKNAREDRKLGEVDKSMRLAAKGTKLSQDNAQNARQMAEAKEKAANKMEAANTELATGVVSGTVQLGGVQAAAGDSKSKGNTVQSCKNCTPSVKPN